jgi:hypothetical protein
MVSTKCLSGLAPLHVHDVDAGRGADGRFSREHVHGHLPAARINRRAGRAIEDLPFASRSGLVSEAEQHGRQGVPRVGVRRGEFERAAQRRRRGLGSIRVEVDASDEGVHVRVRRSHGACRHELTEGLDRAVLLQERERQFLSRQHVVWGREHGLLERRNDRREVALHARQSGDGTQRAVPSSQRFGTGRAHEVLSRLVKPVSLLMDPAEPPVRQTRLRHSDERLAQEALGVGAATGVDEHASHGDARPFVGRVQPDGRVQMLEGPGALTCHQERETQNPVHFGGIWRRRAHRLEVPLRRGQLSAPERERCGTQFGQRCRRIGHQRVGSHCAPELGDRLGKLSTGEMAVRARVDRRRQERRVTARLVEQPAGHLLSQRPCTEALLVGSRERPLHGGDLGRRIGAGARESERRRDAVAAPERPGPMESPGRLVRPIQRLESQPALAVKRRVIGSECQGRVDDGERLDGPSPPEVRMGQFELLQAIGRRSSCSSGERVNREIPACHRQLERIDCPQDLRALVAERPRGGGGELEHGCPDLGLTGIRGSGRT